MSKKIYISKTAKQIGCGSQYKRVDGLTVEEKQMLKEGKTVAFKSDFLSRGNSGTYWRIVKLQNNKFYPRVPANLINFAFIDCL
jgi:hypothetical protein